MNEELKKLSPEVQDNLNVYLERIKKIKWFKPAEEISKKDVNQKVKFALDCFGIKAELEWKKLETVDDWCAAWDAAWYATWYAAREAARGACDIVVADIKTYKEKYPNGAFVNLIPLWELGLYPGGVINGKFVIYIPPHKEKKFPKLI